MPKASVRGLVAISALLIIAACSSSKASSTSSIPPTDLSVKVTDAPTTGALAGTVVDEAGAPIANATVTAGGEMTTTDGSGAFAFAPAPGRAVLVVSAKGKITVTRSVGVTSESPALRLKLVTAAAPQKVTAAGGPLKAGVVTLAIPSGAYPSGGTVAATWIDRAHVSAASGRALFIDQDGARHRFVGQLDVQASAQPAASVTVEIPIPAGTPTQATPVMYANEGAELGQLVMATSVANGVATFTLPHFSSWAMYLSIAVGEVALSAYITAWMVLDVGVGAATVVTDAVTGRAATIVAALQPGDDLPSDSETRDVTVVAPNGAQAYLDAHVSRVHTNDDGTTESTCTEECNVQADVPPTPAPPSGLKKFLIRTKTAVFGVRGTVLSVKQKPCSQADGSAIDTVEVSEGDVDVNIGGFDVDVPAGKQAEGCDGCKDPKQAVCDCDVFACRIAGGECRVCPGQRPEQVSGSINDATGHPINGCLPKGSVCCNGANNTFVSVCSPFPDGPAICQCAGNAHAACATANSVCVPDGTLPAAGVLDCNYGSGTAPCYGPPFPAAPASQWACDSFTYDSSNCGACGNVCPNASNREAEVCYLGVCHAQPCQPNAACYRLPSGPNDAYTNFCSPQTMSCQCTCCAGADCNANGPGSWKCPPGCM
jgi:hypothetical protein